MPTASHRLRVSRGIGGQAAQASARSFARAPWSHWHTPCLTGLTMPERFPIDVDVDRVTAIAYSPAQPLGLTLLFSHGASAGQHDPFVVAYATAIARRGVLVVTYNFPFAEHGLSAPDKSEVLEACVRADIVGARQCRPKNSLFIGGKSLGGRVASKVAAAGGAEMAGVLGLVILGYPLHPLGKPTQRRSRHLSQVDVPVLFVQGSRDVFGTAEELRDVAAGLPKGTELYVAEGGDHSFAVSKHGPLLHETIQDEIVRWMVEVTETKGAARAIAKPRPIAARLGRQLRSLHRSSS